MLLNCFRGLLLTRDIVCCWAKCSYCMSTLSFQSLLPRLEFLALARSWAGPCRVHVLACGHDADVLLSCFWGNWWAEVVFPPLA